MSLSTSSYAGSFFAFYRSIHGTWMAMTVRSQLVTRIQCDYVQHVGDKIISPQGSVRYERNTPRQQAGWGATRSQERGESIYAKTPGRLSYQWSRTGPLCKCYQGQQVPSCGVNRASLWRRLLRKSKENQLMKKVGPRNQRKITSIFVY